MTMKRYLTILISVFMMLSFSAVSSAETIDVSAMDTADLVALLNDVRTELIARLGVVEQNRIGQGTYIVGKDIKAGTFDFMCLETSDTYDDGSAKNAISLHSVDSDSTRIGRIVWSATNIQIGQHSVVSLTDGTALEIIGCSGTLTEIEPSWAP